MLALEKPMARNSPRSISRRRPQHGMPSSETLFHLGVPKNSSCGKHVTSYRLSFAVQRSLMRMGSSPPPSLSRIS